MQRVEPTCWSTRACAFLKGAAVFALFLAAGSPASADETCQSPYMTKITGEEDYVYVWTLGVEGSTPARVPQPSER
jgi:hypothetical protein